MTDLSCLVCGFDHQTYAFAPDAGRQISYTQYQPDNLSKLIDLCVKADLVVLLKSAENSRFEDHLKALEIAVLSGVDHILIGVEHLADFSDTQRRFLEIERLFKAMVPDTVFSMFHVLPMQPGFDQSLNALDFSWYSGPQVSEIFDQVQASSASKRTGGEPIKGHLCTARLVWTGREKLIPGRKYRFRINGRGKACASVMKIKYKLDPLGGHQLRAKKLRWGDFGMVDLSFGEDVPLTPYAPGMDQGVFSLHDKDNTLVARGFIVHVLRRSSNVVWQQTDIDRDIRASLKNQVPRTIWFTGLSGSGKSTLANALEKKLVALGLHTMLLDGDNVRHGLSKNLGFTETDRIENIRRVAEVARLLNDAGLIVMTAFISPYRADRQVARDVIGDALFEVHVSTPLEECERRDIKGLYAKARKGEIPNFTGITAPYETPVNPDLAIDTSQVSTDKGVEQVLRELKIRIQE